MISVRKLRSFTLAVGALLCAWVGRYGQLAQRFITKAAPAVVLVVIVALLTFGDRYWSGIINMAMWAIICIGIAGMVVGIWTRSASRVALSAFFLAVGSLVGVSFGAIDVARIGVGGIMTERSLFWAAVVFVAIVTVALLMVHASQTVKRSRQPPHNEPSTHRSSTP